MCSFEQSVQFGGTFCTEDGLVRGEFSSIGDVVLPEIDDQRVSFFGENDAGCGRFAILKLQTGIWVLKG